jgi:hypothetical protein
MMAFSGESSSEASQHRRSTGFFAAFVIQDETFTVSFVNAEFE